MIAKPDFNPFATWLRRRHGEISEASIQSVLSLAAEGGTVPFIARYRKEATGNLDEQAIREVLEGKETWDEIEKRKSFILKEIEAQEKLTPSLRSQIEATYDLALLEDLYLPFKKKKKTKAQKAKDAGLQPLADWIWGVGHGELPKAMSYVEASKPYEKDGLTAEDVRSGTKDILVERLAELQDVRQFVRGKMFQDGRLFSAKSTDAKEGSKFQNYFSYEESIASLRKPENSHRYLAVRRGWKEKELSVRIGGDDLFMQSLLQAFHRAAMNQTGAFPGKDLLTEACQSALQDYVLPSIDTEVHSVLKDLADEAAITVFAENIRKLLLASPFGPKGVLGIDPGIRTGCKVAIVDETGKYLASTVFHMQSDRDKAHATLLLSEVVKNGNLEAIAIGNGTYSRETEAFVRSVLKEKNVQIPVVLVSESGASVYSASDVAREEFPDLDLTVRGAISIARRLQDPLAELVKVDPKSIGVGQYQHDVSQSRLKKMLDHVVESCVNAVGVYLNTASEYLLSHVSGIGPGLAKNIVQYRNTKGLFRNRQDLLNVERFSQKTFEQAAGFLRISGGDHPLDSTGVHPERYAALERFAKAKGKRLEDLLGDSGVLLAENAELKESLGEFTFADVVEELRKPGRDPRETFVPFSFREDIHQIEDLKPEMWCPGIVTNVTNFGAFVDIGVHQDGLVHLSELTDRFVKDPREVVSPGDAVKVRVLEVDVSRKRISLSMKDASEKRERAPRPEASRTKERSGNRGRRNTPHPGSASRGAPNPRPRKEKPLDPNSPFAVLAKLKLPAK